MFRNFVSIFLLIGVITYQNSQADPLSVSVDAESAILMNADTGVILFEKNAHALQYPASITKIATVSYALKSKGNNLADIVIAEQDSIASISPEAKRRANYKTPSHWVEQGSNHIGIKKGEELTFRDLLYGVMLASANDGSNVIAQFVGGTITEFMTGLNVYLKAIGCEKTHFTNPHGLHHPDHQTTAYEMAIITREALKNPTFCQIVSTVRYTRPKTNKQESTTLVQHNRLLRSGKYYYPKAIGVKTGYTTSAHNTFVGAARHEGRTLIAVLLNSKERNETFTDSINLFEAAFNQPKVQKILLKSGLQKFALDIPGGDKTVRAYTNESLKIEYYPAEEPKVKCLLFWDNLNPPILKDQRVGELRLETSAGVILQKVPLYAADEVQKTWYYWFKNLFKESFEFVFSHPLSVGLYGKN